MTNTDLESITITLAGKEHVTALAGIEVAAASMIPEADLPLDLRHQVTDPEELREAVDAGRLWVAINGKTAGVPGSSEGEKPVGFAITSVVDRQAYLIELSVLPEFGRRGIGTQLLQTVVEWARSNTYATLQLLTFRHLPWNAPFYEKLGFGVLDTGQCGPEITSLIAEEAEVGIDVSTRVAMQLTL